MLSRLQALTRRTKLAIGGTLTVAIVATGAGLWLTANTGAEVPRRTSYPNEGPETLYQYVADLCGEIDWSLPEDEIGAIGDTEVFENGPSKNVGSISSCDYSFGERSIESPAADIDLTVSVESSDQEAINDADIFADAQGLTGRPDHEFSRHWRQSHAGGGIEQRSDGESRDLWIQNLELVVQNRNLIIEMTVQLRSHSEPDTDTVIDNDALTMQIAASLTSQVDEIHDTRP